MSTQAITVDELIPQMRQGRSRQITAIAGPPGAGKSTLAQKLADALNREDAGSAAIFGMDGFHFDDWVLEERGHRARKGAPHTFDVDGYAHMLKRLKRGDEKAVAVPVFDRSIEIARAGAYIIEASVRHIITEGNYLLLDEQPWSALGRHFDRTIYLKVGRETLRRRLIDRWSDLSAAAAHEKVERNDMPNVDLVIGSSRSADFTVEDDG